MKKLFSFLAIIVIVSLVSACNAFKKPEITPAVATTSAPVVQATPTVNMTVEALQNQLNALTNQLNADKAQQTAQAKAQQDAIKQTAVAVVTGQPESAMVQETPQPQVQQVSEQTAPEAQAKSTGPMQFPGFSITGVPAKVDSKIVLQVVGADKFGNTFANKTGLGSEMVFGEPGSILYGPDEPQTIVSNNQHGQYFNPLNQMMLVTDTASVEVAEGAFIMATARDMTVNVDNIEITLDGSDQHIWFLVIRGLFADANRPDRNATAHFSNYVPGHIQVMRHPAGAYISEGQFLQMVETGHTNKYTNAAGKAVEITSSNCGDFGCQGLSVLMLDLNTGAFDVIRQDGQGSAWKFDSSNWFSQ